MKTRLGLFAFVFLSSSVAAPSGCALTVPNAEICADKGLLGATCGFTRGGVVSKPRKIDWDEKRVGWFCMDAKNFGKYQKFIEMSCAQNQSCVDEVNTFVNSLKR